MAAGLYSCICSIRLAYERLRPGVLLVPPGAAHGKDATLSQGISAPHPTPFPTQHQHLPVQTIYTLGGEKPCRSKEY